MVVVIANHLPDAVRGRMKLWFIEPTPNTFISGIKDAVAEKVVDYLYQHCTVESGLMIYYSISSPPGYKILVKAIPKKRQIEISGLQLIIETLKDL